jgi:hypothetical protein
LPRWIQFENVPHIQTPFDLLLLFEDFYLLHGLIMSNFFLFSFVFLTDDLIISDQTYKRNKRKNNDRKRMKTFEQLFSFFFVFFTNDLVKRAKKHKQTNKRKGNV